jgi:hypothetical protein
MEVRYMGFEQLREERTYRFDVSAKGEVTRQFVVLADLALFRTHRVAIQEGPSLCARKLRADLELNPEGSHRLTTDDLSLFAAGVADAEARRIEARKSAGRRAKVAPATYQSPWRGGQP